MKSLWTITLCLLASTSFAGIAISGTTILFDAASVQSTAFSGGGGSAPADHGGTGNTVNGHLS